MVIKCVILDLDNTLLKSFTGNDLRNAYKRVPADLAKQVYLLSFNELHWGIRRPQLKKFLDYLFDNIEIVAVWSAGSYDYVHEIVSIIFGDRKDKIFIYTRNDCETDQNGNLYKPIRKMLDNVPGLKYKATLANTIIIDDLEGTFSRNPDNAIHIPAYNPEYNKIDNSDVALLQIIVWIDFYKNVRQDIREIDKKRIFLTRVRECQSLADYQQNICDLAKTTITAYS